MNLGRKLPAVFCSHHSLDIFHDTRNQASVVVEFLRAIGNLETTLFADELVVRTLINVLKAPPTTYVKDQDMTKSACPDPISSSNWVRPALFLIFRPLTPSAIGANDLELVQLRIRSNDRCLIFD